MEEIKQLSYKSQVGDRVHLNGERGTVRLRVNSKENPESATLVVLFEKDENKHPLVFSKFSVWNPVSDGSD